MAKCVELQEISFKTKINSLQQQEQCNQCVSWTVLVLGLEFVTTLINDNINPDLFHLGHFCDWTFQNCI